MNIVEIGLAFLEGVALIVSPCILPVLPLVLAASVEGGRRRPYGIIIGFVAAFSLFAIVLRELITLLNLDVELVRNASLVLLTLFGLILLSEKLSEKFSAMTSWAATIGNNLSSKGGEGLLSGVFIGSLIGFVWTPCAGPILAAVLVQVIRQQSDFGGDLIIIAFALGAGLPMLLISIFGRKVMKKMSFFTRHAEGVRKTFGVLILLAVAYIAAGTQALAFFGSSTSVEQTPTGELSLQHALDKPYPAPEFVGLQNWINSEPLTMEKLKGKVVLVDFWTYSCINCIRTLPYITEWDRKYRNQGLVIVGVHSPEFDFERKLDNVKAAVTEYGIHYPVAQDNNFDTWDRFKNRYWPAHYLIDRDGNVVYTHFGEGQYDVTENNIRYLLGIQGKASMSEQEKMNRAADQTPETYLGYQRASTFVGNVKVIGDEPMDFTFPEFIPGNDWALNGRWTVEGERIISEEKGAALRLNFKSSKVFLVLGSHTGKPIHVTVRLNGQAVGTYGGKDVVDGTVTVDRNTLYELVNQKSPNKGLLEIESDAPGLEAYAFTFG